MGQATGDRIVVWAHAPEDLAMAKCAARALGARPVPVADLDSALRVLDHDPGIRTLVLQVGGQASAMEQYIRAVRSPRCDVVVVAIGGEDASAPTVVALRAGAQAYVPRGAAFERLADALRPYLSDPVPAAIAGGAFLGFYTQDETALEVLRDLCVYARADRSVLIRGASGCGKELLAKGVHRASRRGGGQYRAINAAGLTETLLASELFGHVRGSFSGATENKVGLFEVCNGGVLFLDEIGDISPALQAALLRVLQTRDYLPVGATESRVHDALVVCATNADLVAKVRAGTFREDLYHRLAAHSVRMPSLSERPGDIRYIGQRLFRDAIVRLNCPAPELSAGLWAALETHPFRGNVRELQSLMEKAILFGEGPVRARMAETAALATAGTAPGTERTWRERGDEVLRAIESCGGNKRAAARKLGIHPSTLYAALKERARAARELEGRGEVGEEGTGRT